MKLINTEVYTKEELVFIINELLQDKYTYYKSRPINNIILKKQDIYIKEIEELEKEKLDLLNKGFNSIAKLDYVEKQLANLEEKLNKVTNSLVIE